MGVCLALQDTAADFEGRRCLQTWVRDMERPGLFSLAICGIPGHPNAIFPRSSISNGIDKGAVSEPVTQTAYPVLALELPELLVRDRSTIWSLVGGGVCYRKRQADGAHGQDR